MMNFEKNEKLKRNFTYSECIILINILNVNKNIKYLTRSKIAKEIKVSQFDPRISKIFNYLKYIKVIKESIINSNTKLLEIDCEQLTNFIDEQIVITDLVNNFLKKHHIFSWTPPLIK